MKSPLIRAFFDEPTDTASYLVWDPATKEGVVIDPVVDWNNRSRQADTRSADAIPRTGKSRAGGRVKCDNGHGGHLGRSDYLRASPKRTRGPRAQSRTGGRNDRRRLAHPVPRNTAPATDTPTRRPRGSACRIACGDTLERFDPDGKPL